MPHLKGLSLINWNWNNLLTRRDRKWASIFNFVEGFGSRFHDKEENDDGPGSPSLEDHYRNVFLHLHLWSVSICVLLLMCSSSRRWWWEQPAGSRLSAQRCSTGSCSSSMSRPSKIHPVTSRTWPIKTLFFQSASGLEGNIRCCETHSALKIPWENSTAVSQPIPNTGIGVVISASILPVWVEDSTPVSVLIPVCGIGICASTIMIITSMGF